MAAARNLECKARDPDPERSLRIALALGARDEGLLWQRDTYFVAPAGRLKLREQRADDVATAQLIHYRRADVAEQRESAYQIVAIPDPAGLTAALGDALGVGAIVVKWRRLLLWQRVRIHLDRVDGLGSFIELEAVLADDESPEDAGPQVVRLREALAIADADLEPHGYAALSSARRKRSRSAPPT
jgi:adenylate cyclase class 2